MMDCSNLANDISVALAQTFDLGSAYGSLLAMAAMSLGFLLGRYFR